jgi:hypothetical protein
MVQMTVQLSDELAERCKSVGPWLSTIIELSLAGFGTPAAATASEVTDFLFNNPSPDEVLDFHVSESAQLRLRRLLALNEAGTLSDSERLELDELQRLEHVIVKLKGQLPQT